MRFYSFFGLAREQRAETPDHLSVELEFMQDYPTHLEAVVGDDDEQRRPKAGRSMISSTGICCVLSVACVAPLAATARPAWCWSRTAWRVHPVRDTAMSEGMHG